MILEGKMGLVTGAATASPRPYDALEIPADPGQTIIAYSAEPGSAAHQALGILASWASTQPRAGRLNTAEPRTGTPR